MPTDLPMAILFLLFLALFVLLGTSPVLHRLIALVGKLLRDNRRTQGPAGRSRLDEFDDEPRWKDSPLNDYEILVLRKLALARSKGLSRKDLVAGLYFKPVTIDKSLDSLVEKGMLRSVKPYPFGERFFLSSRGQDYAVEHDLIPCISQTVTRND